MKGRLNEVNNKWVISFEFQSPMRPIHHYFVHPDDVSRGLHLWKDMDVMFDLEGEYARFDFIENCRLAYPNIYRECEAAFKSLKTNKHMSYTDFFVGYSLAVINTINNQLKTK